MVFLVRSGIERRAVDGGDFVAALEQLGGHAAGACSEFQPMGALRWEGAVHGEEVESLGDFRTGSADGVVGILRDELRAAGMEAAGLERGGHSGVDAFPSDEAKEGFLGGVLLFSGFR